MRTAMICEDLELGVSYEQILSVTKTHRPRLQVAFSRGEGRQDQVCDMWLQALDSVSDTL